MENRLYTIRELMDLANPDFASRSEQIPQMFREELGNVREILDIVNRMDPYAILPLICTLFDDFCEKAEIKNREAVFNILYQMIIMVNAEAVLMYPETKGEEENGSGEDQEP